MNASLQKIIESKRALRRELSSQPIAAKLRMLDALRQRQATAGRDVRTRPAKS